MHLRYTLEYTLTKIPSIHLSVLDGEILIIAAAEDNNSDLKQ